MRLLLGAVIVLTVAVVSDDIEKIGLAAAATLFAGYLFMIGD